MSNRTALRQVLNDSLIEMAEADSRIVVLASDSRGSAAITPFTQKYPEKFVEVGIAEQNIVGIAAGLASCGKTPYVMSPACFLSMRSIEQIKVDVAYSKTNVRLIGISGGVSYGALGMSHHSVQDIAVTRAIPGLAVILPADKHDAKKLAHALQNYDGGAYVRIGRNPVADVYDSDDYEFEIGKSIQLGDGEDLTIIAVGETVRVALDARNKLADDGIGCRVINMHTIKPLDTDAIIRAAKETGKMITLEEHSIFGGLGAAVSEVVVQNYPVPVKILGIPDEPAITGKTDEVFHHYGISAENISSIGLQMVHGQRAT